MNNTVTLDLETYNELYTKAMLYDEKKKEVESFAERVRINNNEVFELLRKTTTNYPTGGLK